MTIWRADAPEIISVLAYAAMAAALAPMLAGRHAPALGSLRWPLLGAVVAQVPLQLLLGVSLTEGWPAGGFALGASIGQLGIAFCLFVLLQGVRPRLARAMGTRARDRLARAEQHAGEAQAWLQLAEQAVSFGHWRISIPDRAVEWSDAVFHLHGVTPEDFAPTVEGVVALFHPDDRNILSQHLAVVMAQGGSLDLRIRLLRPDLELRHVILRGQAHGGTVVGVMVDVTEQRLAEARMREANVAALQANVALKEISTEDELTGISNRRRFDLSLVHEFKRAVRSSLPLGLVLIDIDQFQAFNEQYGRLAGDACLRRIAQAIKAVPRRAGDLVARFAGEEIVALLPLADEAGALRVANVIHAAVQVLQIPHTGSDTGFLTVSCGSAAFTGLQDLNNPLELVRRADQALYKSKTNGRDRVTRFEPGMGSDRASPYADLPMIPDMERFIKSRI